MIETVTVSFNESHSHLNLQTNESYRGGSSWVNLYVRSDSRNWRQKEAVQRLIPAFLEGLERDIYIRCEAVTFEPLRFSPHLFVLLYFAEPMSSSRALEAFVRFGAAYQTKKKALRNRDFQIAMKGIARLREEAQVAAVEIVEGYHDSSRRPGGHQIDRTPHITVRPVGNDGRSLPFTLHMYEDGSNNYVNPQRQLATPAVAVVSSPSSAPTRKRKKSSGCIVM